MDLQDQLRNLFPEHSPAQEDSKPAGSGKDLWMQEAPIVCKYEKRKGKPVTVLEGYTGADDDFKSLSREIKQWLGVGGSCKKDRILIQGDYREQIMDFLKNKGFKVKRVGG